MPNNPDLYRTGTVEDWAFRDAHLAYDAGGRNTNPITGETVMIAGGPARYSDTSADWSKSVLPIGAIDSLSVAQTKQVQQLSELGSRLSYVVGGRSTGTININRVLFSFSSLLRDAGVPIHVLLV